MKRFRLTLLSALLSVGAYHHVANAAAFQLYELGTPIIATAGVGQAVVNDASSAYFNPASMTLLPNTELMLGSQLMVPYFNFSKNTNTTILGNNGGNAGNLVPGMSLYYAYDLSPKVKLGVSLNTPFGGAMSYADGWVGRFYVQQVFFYTINLNPSMAYKINDWAAFGVGVSAEYINLQETVALPIPGTKLNGQVKLSLANIAPGFNAGVIFTPSKSTRIGVAYRSQIVHHLSGNAMISVISETPSTNTKMVDPAEVILSAAQNINGKFNLLAELGWANWASMRDTILTVKGYSATVPQNWNNTWRVGLGGQYQAYQNLMLQLGGSFDSSPTTSNKRLPDLPMDKQIRLGVGVIYKVIKAVSLGVSYEYINFGRGTINNTSSNGIISGYYKRNYADVVQISMNVDI